MFDDPENGIKKYQFFNPLVKHTYQFPFRAFFDWSDFFTQLTNIAKFVELEFKFDSKLVDLHIEFLKHTEETEKKQRERGENKMKDDSKALDSFKIGK
jgi:hypothetical protein